MDTAMKQEIRSRLEAERAKELDRLEEVDVVAPEKSVHNIMRNETGFEAAAQEARQRSHRLGELDHTRSRLDQVEAALERLDDGSFGTCDACDEAIADDRLVSLPLVTRCLDCAEEEPA